MKSYVWRRGFFLGRESIFFFGFKEKSNGEVGVFVGRG